MENRLPQDKQDAATNMICTEAVIRTETTREKILKNLNQ